MASAPEVLPSRIYFEDVGEGHELPPMDRHITLTGMVMYAAATWDFHRCHYDDQFARAAGFPAPFVDGQMLGALLAKQVMDWAGPDAFLRRLSYRVRHMVFPGDRIVSRGKVVETRRETGGGVAVCELSVWKQGDIEVVKQARATVELLSRRAVAASGDAGRRDQRPQADRASAPVGRCR